MPQCGRSPAVSAGNNAIGLGAVYNVVYKRSLTDIIQTDNR